MLAMLPAIVASVWLYGINSLRIIALCVGISVALDWLINRIVLPQSSDVTTNWTSVTLGVMLALLMPLNAPWWLIFVGCLVMIGIGKKIYGGTGAYPVNPVMLSFAILFVSWPHRFDYTAAYLPLDFGIKMIEPMQLIKTVGSSAEAHFSWTSLLLGNYVSGIGNGFALCLLIGGIFLIFVRQISWHIPVSFLAGVVVMAVILKLAGCTTGASPIFHLLKGSAIFGAFFIATESTTSPVNPVPMLIYGFIGGMLLVLIRTFSIYPIGLPFTILLINLFNPLLDKITPKIYGAEVIDNV